jgi:hypothetical protein
MGVPYLNVSDDQLYNAVALAAPAWLMLMFAPNHARRQEVVRYTILGCCVLYTLLMGDVLRKKGFHFFGDMRQSMNLAGIRNVLANRDAALPAWLHFVAFDLWVANKVTDDNLTSGGLPQWLMAATLVLMAGFGPAGFLFYVVATQLWPEVRNKANSRGHTGGAHTSRGLNLGGRDKQL